MGEETVQSTREGGVASVEPESVTKVGTVSKTRGGAESGTVSMTVRGGGGDSSTISNWMGMPECVLMEGGGSVELLELSVIGTGEGAGDGGRLSCIDGVGESAEVA